jgi:hypothetical protein
MIDYRPAKTKTARQWLVVANTSTTAKAANATYKVESSQDRAIFPHWGLDLQLRASRTGVELAACGF